MQRANLANLAVPFTVAACIAGAALVAATANADKRLRFPIDLAELRAAEEARFNAADADSDGLVSAAELAATRSERRRGGPPRFHGRSQRGVFDAADTDGSGELSREEFDDLPQAVRRASQAREFARLDDNEDGFLTPDEFPSRADRLARLDADGDGQITRAEMPARWKRRR